MRESALLPLQIIIMLWNLYGYLFLGMTEALEEVAFRINIYRKHRLVINAKTCPSPSPKSAICFLEKVSCHFNCKRKSGRWNSFRLDIVLHWEAAFSDKLSYSYPQVATGICRKWKIFSCIVHGLKRTHPPLPPTFHLFISYYFAVVQKRWIQDFRKMYTT